MKGFVPPDPETDVSTLAYAVVYAPKTRRKRFPAGCVTRYPDRDSALAHADPGRHRYAATVLGPSKSSEGQYLYYLMEWLDRPD